MIIHRVSVLNHHDKEVRITGKNSSVRVIPSHTILVDQLAQAKPDVVIAETPIYRTLATNKLTKMEPQVTADLYGCFFSKHKDLRKPLVLLSLREWYAIQAWIETLSKAQFPWATLGGKEKILFWFNEYLFHCQKDKQ